MKVKRCGIYSFSNVFNDEMIFLFDLPILPERFEFPLSYLTMVKEGQLPALEPWSFLCRDKGASLSYYGSMLTYYKDKVLVPFAIANDSSGLFNDGYVILACFDGSDYSGNPCVYYHDYGNNTKVEWENRYKISSFDEWLELTKDESANYKADLED